MTLNQIVKLFEKFAADHLQINDFGHGSLSEIAASKDQKYPLMWLYFDTSTYRPNVMEYPFQVILMDLIFEAKNKNELEVQSDMLQVAQDLIAEFRDNPDYVISIPNDVAINFFTDRFTDLVAGVTINLTIRDPKPLDRCVIPK